MEINFLLKGIILGFSIAAPVGPIGVLCIRRTLSKGRATGFASGLGAATADAFYGSIAGFGLTFISEFLLNQKSWLNLLGGVFLGYLGIKTLLSKALVSDMQRPPGGRKADEGGDQSKAGVLAAYGSTLLLTLTNPMTILSFAVVFAGLGIADAAGDYRAAGMLVAGVFTGSALWWLLLTGGVSLFRTKINAQAMQWVNWLSGAVLLVFGALCLA